MKERVGWKVYLGER